MYKRARKCIQLKFRDYKRWIIRAISNDRLQSLEQKRNQRPKYIAPIIRIDPSLGLPNPIRDTYKLAELPTRPGINYIPLQNDPNQMHYYLYNSNPNYNLDLEKISTILNRENKDSHLNTRNIFSIKLKQFYANKNKYNHLYQQPSNNSNNNTQQIQPQKITHVLLVLPEDPGSFNDSDFLNRILGYNHLNHCEKVIYSSVFIFGKRKSFHSFHVHLDRFLFTHRLYRVNFMPYIDDMSNKEDADDLVLFTSLFGIQPETSLGRYFKRLDYHQFPQLKHDLQCHQIPSITTELKQWGLTSTLRSISSELKHSIETSRVLTLQFGEFQYGKWELTFLNISNCDFYDYESKLGKVSIPLSPRKMNQFLHSHVNPNFKQYVYSHQSPPSKFYFNGYYDNVGIIKFHESFVPFGLSEWFKNDINRYGLQYLVEPIGYTLDWVMRPSWQFRQFMARSKHQLFGLSGHIPRCVSMHVRHGDKASEAKLLPFSYYVDGLKMLDLKGINTVFLMTDDPLVAESAVVNASKPDLKFVLLNITRIEYNTQADDYFEKENRERYAHELLTEIEIASECEYFIGTISSNIGKLILERALLKVRTRQSKFRYINIDNVPYNY
eukprot:gene1425-1799_t